MSNSIVVESMESGFVMRKNGESKEEMVERLTRQFRELLEKKLPEEPGTLEEIERVTEEIGTEGLLRFGAILALRRIRRTLSRDTSIPSFASSSVK